MRTFERADEFYIRYTQPPAETAGNGRRKYDGKGEAYGKGRNDRAAREEAAGGGHYDGADRVSLRGERAAAEMNNRIKELPRDRSVFGGVVAEMIFI